MYWFHIVKSEWVVAVSDRNCLHGKDTVTYVLISYSSCSGMLFNILYISSAVDSKWGSIARLCPSPQRKAQQLCVTCTQQEWCQPTCPPPCPTTPPCTSQQWALYQEVCRRSSTQENTTASTSTLLAFSGVSVILQNATVVLEHTVHVCMHAHKCKSNVILSCGNDCLKLSLHVFVIFI